MTTENTEKHDNSYASQDMHQFVHQLLSGIGRTETGSREITHRPVEHIVHQLAIGPVERTLFWLSKTDIYALAACTYHTRLTLSALGLMVLFTSTLALIAGYTSLSIVIDPRNEYREVVAILGAAIYAFGIMIIDREIVGNPSQRAMWVRLVFAFLVAIAVSYPIKLKLLDGPIKAEISEMVEERNAAKLQRMSELRSQGVKYKEEQIRTKDEQLDGIRKHMRELEAQIRDERTRQDLGARCDKRCEAAKAQLLVMQGVENKVIEERDRLRAEDALPPDAQAELKSLAEAVEKQKREAHDFLSYWQAQDRVMRKDQSGARVLSYFLFAFFLCLELVPVVLKYALGTSEYHQYLEARIRLNLQKMTSVTNLLLVGIQRAGQQDDWQAGLEEIMSLPAELTDLLWYVIEDSMMPLHLDPKIRQALEARLRSRENARDQSSPAA